jgi:hypothetical protein
MEHEAIITEALKAIFSGIGQLRDAFSPKKFTIDGRLVGDIGEVIAAREYDIKPYEGQTKDYDGETSDGKKVQIKATFKDSLTFKGKPDYYLGLKLYENGQPEEIFNGPGKVIFERYKHREGIGKKLLSFPNKELKNLSKNVPESERIPPRRESANK